MQRSRQYGPRWLIALSLLGLIGAPAASAAPEPSAFRQLTNASWYGNDFLGKRMASGQNFDPQKLTAAHRTLNLGSRVKVTDLRTGRSVVVQITDRGPYVAGRGIDLSYAAAQALGIVQRGVAPVRIDLLGREQRPANPPIVTAMGPSLFWMPKAIVK